MTPATSDLRTARVDSPLGPLRLTASEAGLVAVDFTDAPHPAATVDAAAVAPYAAALEAYFGGDVHALEDLAVDWREGTAFQRETWAALRRIPPGETRSYKWLAEAVGRPRAFRAVGAANGCNPTPVVVPCHRVIAADGTLGGYSGGLDVKRRLLSMEGMVVPPATSRTSDR